MELSNAQMHQLRRDLDKQSGELDQNLTQLNIRKGDNQLITYELSEAASSIIPVGSIVRVNDGNITNISIVIKYFINLRKTIVSESNNIIFAKKYIKFIQYIDFFY